MSDENFYDIGDEVVLQAEFDDLDNAPTDPTLVVCRILEPDGTITELDTDTADTGIYTAQFSVTQSGEHWFRYEGTGALTAAGERRFFVRVQHVGMAS